MEMRRKKGSAMLRSLAVWTVIWAVLAPPLSAKGNNPNIDLEFLPQQSLGEAEFTLRRELYERGVRLEVVDERRVEDQFELGWRTDGDDRRHTLRATDDVGAYVAEVLEEVARERGLLLEDQADRVLTVEVRRFWIEETNQAVGATYKAVVDLTAVLRVGGEERWSGAANGDASRYGRAFSNDNVNEVFSDALLEAYAALLSTDGLQRAWAGS